MKAQTAPTQELTALEPAYSTVAPAAWCHIPRAGPQTGLPTLMLLLRALSTADTPTVYSPVPGPVILLRFSRVALLHEMWC